MVEGISDGDRLTRRAALRGAAALGATGVWATAARASGPGADMQVRAARWLDGLDGDQRARALVGFEDPLRRNWSFMHGSRVAPGLPLERMSAAQQDAALDLLATGLSADGLATAENIMLQQDILRDEWNKGSPDRNRRRFSMLVFGTPGAAAWGWRFEGHHLSLSYTLVRDQVVSVTPSSFSSEPNTVPSGPHRGLVVLPGEESMGRALFADLSDANRRAALIQQDSFGNILATAGNLGRITAPAGVPLGDLPQGQIDRVQRLLEVYAVDHLPELLAAPERARLAEGDVMSVRFGWAGGNVQDQSIYYRLHGPTFVIEFATLRQQPLHHHAVRHDLRRNFGAHVI